MKRTINNHCEERIERRGNLNRFISIVLAMLMLFSAFSSLSFSAAEIDTAATGESYDLWLGSTQVTDDNKDDILNDGGKAKFDPDTYTLTLNDPNIGGWHNKAKISTDSIGLTVKGSYSMTSAETDYGLYCHETLRLDGDFAFLGTDSGLYCFKDLYIDGGSLYAEGGNYGISWPDNLTIAEPVSRVEAKGGKKAIRCYISFESAHMMTVPADGFISGTQFYEADGTTEAVHVVLEPDPDYDPSAEYYDLWLGSKQVTSNNKDDILGDGGKAKFDPETNTLTLNEPNISGLHNKAKISTESIELTVKGKYLMTSAESDYGIYSDNTLLLYGDFAFYGTSSGVCGYLDIYIGSGSLYAEGGDYGIVWPDNLTIAEPVSRVEAKGGEEAIQCNICFESALEMTVPAGGVIEDNSFYESDGTTIAKHVVFEKVKEITSVSVNITAPAAGEKLSFDATVPDSKGYKVETKYYTSGVNWYDEDGIWIDPDAVGDSYTFEAGKEYTVEVLLVTASNAYLFADENNLSATINGEEASIDIAEPGEMISVLYTFTVPAASYVLGDANGDEDVSSVDVTLIQRYCADFSVNVSEETLLHGDVDGSGDLDIRDATLIQRFLADFSVQYPIGEWV